MISGNENQCLMLDHLARLPFSSVHVATNYVGIKEIAARVNANENFILLVWGSSIFEAYINKNNIYSSVI